MAEEKSVSAGVGWSPIFVPDCLIGHRCVSESIRLSLHYLYELCSLTRYSWVSEDSIPVADNFGS